MRKLSLMIACVGIVSIAAFGSGIQTNPQNDGKKQKTQEAAKPSSAAQAAKPIEVAKPVQTVTSPSATPAKVETVQETKGGTPKTNEPRKASSHAKATTVKHSVTTEKAQPAGTATEKK